MEKKYRHFDYNPSNKSANCFIKRTVYNPKSVSCYRFYPFIVFNKKKILYHRTKGNLRAHFRIKNRPIALVAHHDSLIYVHYADLLSKKYESYLSDYKDGKLLKVPTAYRKKLHISNITSAKEVFDFIVVSQNCLIIKGDFKGFFDNLRHKILINNLCNVMKVEKLTPDWKSVIASLTKYRFTYSKDIINAMKKIGLKNDTNHPYVKSRKEINSLIKKGGLLMHGPNQIGIPQGTSLSAVLANVYMVEFDKKINEFINNMKGIYRRYSDDFIIVIPNENLKISYEETLKEIIHTCQKYTKLTIEKHKTKSFIYNDDNINKIESINKQNMNWLDYLGFSFNGNIVKIRDKSIYKFHYKSKKSINALISNRKYLKLINDKVEVNPENHYRKVWNHKIHKFKKLYQPAKQKEFLKKVNRIKKNTMPINSQLVSQMYLSHKRYGKEWSMISYARKAQRVFEKGNKYKVIILDQINKQVAINQKHISKS